MKNHAAQLVAQADLILLAAQLLAGPAPARPLPGPLAAEEIDQLVTTADLETSRERSRDLVRLWNENGTAALAAEHGLLFATEKLCPIHESGWVRRDRGNIIGDISGFYAAFGLRVGKDAGERPDHLAMQLEFVGLVLVMMAKALAQNLAEQEEISREALAAFVRDHLGCWLPSFAAHLQTVGGPCMAATGLWLAELWDALRQAHGWQIDPLPIGPPPNDEGTPYECGMVAAQ
jgi:TorA maturation chaperone TorD